MAQSEKWREQEQRAGNDRMKAPSLKQRRLGTDCEAHTHALLARGWLRDLLKLGEQRRLKEERTEEHKRIKTDLVGQADKLEKHVDELKKKSAG